MTDKEVRFKTRKSTNRMNVNVEQARESANTLRIAGVMLAIVALLLYFFHMAASRLGQSAMGIAALVLLLVGVVLFVVGWRRVRALR